MDPRCEPYPAAPVSSLPTFSLSASNTGGDSRAAKYTPPPASEAELFLTNDPDPSEIRGHRATPSANVVSTSHPSASPPPLTATFPSRIDLRKSILGRAPFISDSRPPPATKTPPPFPIRAALCSIVAETNSTLRVASAYTAPPFRSATFRSNVARKRDALPPATTSAPPSTAELLVNSQF